MSSDPEPNNPPATSSSLNSVVTLNVGGTRFETTRQTLLTDPNSMLAKMFDPVSPLQPGVMRDGAYFIDRDPKYFGIILNYLRCRQLILQPDTHVSLESIKVEASFFGLTSLEEEIVDKITESEQSRTSDGDEFKLNVGGEIFVTTKETLCKFQSRLSNLVEGKCRQQFDKNGVLFLDEDPKDFAHILRALRNSHPSQTQNVPTAVPKESIDNILSLRDNLEIREIKFGYREQSNNFVSEYFLSNCSYENQHQRATMTYGPGNELGHAD